MFNRVSGEIEEAIPCAISDSTDFGLSKKRETMQPVEMALEAALIVMQNGGSTAAADRSFTNVLAGYKKEGVSAVWRLDFIAASSTGEGQASTAVRTVGPIGVNLARASEVAVLGERVAKGEVATATLGAELARIRTLPSPYNRWVTITAAACTAAFFSQIAGGDWGSLAIAFVAGAVGQFLRSLLQARKLAVAPVTLICGVLSACIASVGLRLGFSQVAPATLIASVIYVVPGLPLINGFVDVASHKYLLVGVERMINAAFLFLVIAIAIAFAYTVIA
jgi:uncharacterized membrane protein YjjP (DUF1212 family)